MGGGEVYNGKDIYLREKGWRRRWAGGAPPVYKEGEGGTIMQILHHLVRSFIYRYTETGWCIHSFIYSFIHFVSCKLIHSSFHSSFLCLVNLFILLFNLLFIYSFTRLAFYKLIHSFLHSFIH